MAGIRDHALLVVFFKTACRVSALAEAKIGSIQRSDFDFYLAVEEKVVVIFVAITCVGQPSRTLSSVDRSWNRHKLWLDTAIFEQPEATSTQQARSPKRPHGISKYDRFEVNGIFYP